MVQSEKEIARNALAYVEDKIHSANRLFEDSQSNDPRIDATWKSGALQKAKDELSLAIQMFRWLNDRNSITLPAAFTDAEVTTIGNILEVE